MATVHPEVLWAQRSSDSDPEKNYVYLTLTVTDVPEKGMTLDLQPTKLTFKGASDSKKVTYATELEFYAEIDPKASKISHTSKNVEIVLRKKELKEEFWPRLLKDKARVHFLKTDFDKWVDEDEQEEAAADDMSGMGDMGGMGGMPGMGGMGGMPGMGGMGGGDGGFGGIDFSKLAGMGGMEGLGGMGGMGGMPGMGGMGGDDDGEDLEGDDDGEDMPELEEPSAGKGKAPAASSAAGGSKIEELE